MGNSCASTFPVIGTLKSKHLPVAGADTVRRVPNDRRLLSVESQITVTYFTPARLCIACPAI
jgi:hypothetical protein